MLMKGEVWWILSLVLLGPLGLLEGSGLVGGQNSSLAPCQGPCAASVMSPPHHCGSTEGRVRLCTAGRGRDLLLGGRGSQSMRICECELALVGTVGGVGLVP